MTGRRGWVRWLAPVVIIALALFVFRDQLPFLAKARSQLAHAQVTPLLAAVCTALLAIFAMSGVMQILLNVERRIAHPANTNAIVLASNAWSTTVPGGPALSAWLTFRVHRSWGASVGLCGWFFVVSGALSTVWMALIGVGAVAMLGAELSIWSLGGTIVAALVTMWVVFWATRNPETIKRWFRFLPSGARARVGDVIDQVGALRISGPAFAAAAALSLCNQLFDVATMIFSVWAATGAPPDNLVGICLAYIMTKLAGAAQITPGGVGTVEPVAAGMLVASGMTLASATAATVLYRAVSFLLISAIGWVIYAAVYARRGYLVGIRQAEAERGDYAAGHERATDDWTQR